MDDNSDDLYSYKPKSDRPLGITIIAVLQIIGTFIGVIMLLLLPQYIDLSIIREYLGDYFLDIVYIRIIVEIPFTLLLSFGLLKGKEWARYATFLYQIVSIITSLIKFNIFGIIVPIIILSYLGKPHVKKFFETEQGIKPKIKALIIIWTAFILIFSSYIAVVSNSLYIYHQFINQSKNSKEKELIGTWQSESGTVTLTFYSNHTSIMIKNGITYRGKWKYSIEINWISLEWNNSLTDDCHFIGDNLSYN
ncbi:MAG TPA: hypothetical protein ENI14_04100, partial [Thermoplasmatales archaeon]|nr:hypothetical protein [Thermoplasmatales archaeon]